MKKRIAYILSKFPIITETFILRELLEVRKCSNIDLYIFSLKNPKKNEIMHNEAKNLIPITFYSKYLSSYLLLFSNFYFLLRSPLIYFCLIFYIIKHNYKSLNFLLKSLIIFPKAVYFAKIMKNKGINHIHACWATYPTIVAIIIKRLTGIKFGFTAHAYDIFLDRTMLGEKIKQAEYVLTCSKYNKQILDRYGFPQKIFVVYCGIDPEDYKPDFKKRSYLLTVGTLCERKGYRYLLEAYRTLKEKGINFKALIVGSGPLKRKIKRYIRKFNLPVEVINYLPHGQIKILFNKAKMFILPCVKDSKGDMDGIPNVLIESLIMEVPVISTNISGIPELIANGRNGLLIPEKNSEILANEIIKLLEDKNLRIRFNKEGRKMVLEKFNIKQNINLILKFLK